MDCIALLVNGFVIGIILFLFYRYFVDDCHYWKKKKIPFVKQSLIFNLFVSIIKTTQELQIERNKNLGRIYGYYDKNCPVLSVSEPSLLKHILVKDFKSFSTRRNADDSLDSFSARMLNNLRFEDWKRVRIIVSPTFSTSKLKKIMSIFTDCSLTLIKNFEISRQQQDIVEVKRIFSAFTMDVIASSAFSTKIDSYNNPDNYFVKKARTLFAQCPWLKFTLFHLLGRFLGGNWSSKLFSNGLKFFEDFALHIIQSRKKTGKEKNDFLQLLMDASIELEQDMKLEDDLKDIAENLKKEWKNNDINLTKSLSVDELTAQCAIFFLAGYHTTAATLSFATYLLAVHQDVQEKVYEEIKSVLQQSNGTLSYEELQKMNYLDNVVSETLRMYPPAPKLDRVAVENCNLELGHTGIVVPKGMKVSVPVYALHRDPELYSQPNQFNPDRFNLDNRSKIIPYSYLPFGAGPRNCVAMRFALIEIKVCLVHLLSSFHIQRCSQTKVPLEFHNGRHLLPFLNLLPKDIKVKMELRKENPLRKI